MLQKSPTFFWIETGDKYQEVENFSGGEEGEVVLISKYLLTKRLSAVILGVQKHKNFLIFIFYVN